MKSDFATDCWTGFALRYLPYDVLAIDMHKNTNTLMINFCLQKNVATSIFHKCKLIFWLSIYCLSFKLYWLSILLEIFIIIYVDKKTSNFLGHRSVTVIEWKTSNNLVKYLAIQSRLQKLISPFFLYNVHLTETKKKWKRQEVGAR